MVYRGGWSKVQQCLDDLSPRRILHPATGDQPLADVGDMLMRFADLLMDQRDLVEGHDDSMRDRHPHLRPPVRRSTQMSDVPPRSRATSTSPSAGRAYRRAVDATMGHGPHLRKAPAGPDVRPKSELATVNARPSRPGRLPMPPHIATACPDLEYSGAVATSGLSRPLRMPPATVASSNVSRVSCIQDPVSRWRAPGCRCLPCAAPTPSAAGRSPRPTPAPLVRWRSRPWSH